MCIKYESTAQESTVLSRHQFRKESIVQDSFALLSIAEESVIETRERGGRGGDGK